MQDVHPHMLPSPPGWSLQVGEIGRSLVIAAAALFMVSALAWILSPKFPRLRAVGSWGFTLASASLIGAFVSLAILFANDRFEFEYVFGHGDKRNALAYKIAGVWSGQEGSFLLWGVTAAIFGVLAAPFSGALRRWFTVPYALFLAAISAILWFESPFNLIQVDGRTVVPPDGNGLAPALQNYWVIIHPPTIFLGFGSLTVLFAYAIAAMCTGQVREWIPKVRPWALISLTLVGLGLCMGGLWAYETLGWGGFWAWDPVENTSFVPWALNAAFVHGMIVQANKGKWTVSNLLLGGAPFLSFVYGTFLTRSGFLGDTSVHSFAEMDSKALWLLIGVFAASVLGFGALCVYRARKLGKEFFGGKDEPASFHREGTYRWGALLLVCTALTTAIGMSVPMFMSLAGHKPKVVEEWLYHQVVPWFFIPLMLLIGLSPFVSWGGIGLGKLAWRLYGPACIAFGLVGATLLLLMRSPWGQLGQFNETIRLPVNLPFGFKLMALPWVLILAGLCFFAAIANAWRIVESVPKRWESVATLLSHVGVAVVLAGLIVSRGLERKAQVFVQEGSFASGLGYMLTFKGTTSNFSDRDNKVLLELQDLKGQKFIARPGLYYVTDPAGNANPMAWPYIRRAWDHDVYLTAHPLQFDASGPMTVKPGQKVSFDKFTIQYVRLTQEGQPGQEGTKFGAELRVAAGDMVMTVHPKIRLGAGGLVEEPALVDADHFIALKSMNAGDKSVTLQLHFVNPLFPVEMFYKPLTILVWAGLGILTLGGLMAAWLRRRSPVPPLPSPTSGEAPPTAS